MAKSNLPIVLGLAVGAGLVAFLLSGRSNKPDPNKPDPNKPDPNKPDPNKPDPNKPEIPEDCDDGYEIFDGKCVEDCGAGMARGNDGKCYPTSEIECYNDEVPTLKQGGGFACCPKGSIIVINGKCRKPEDFPSAMRCYNGMQITLKHGGGFGCCPSGSVFITADGKCI